LPVRFRGRRPLTSRGHKAWCPFTLFASPSADFGLNDPDEFRADEYKVENDRPLFIWSARREWDQGGKQFHCVVQERRKDAMLTTRDVWGDSDVPGPRYFRMSWFNSSNEKKQ
jgi:hypothetical protein